MIDDDTAGLASPYQWDVSASWTSAGIGVLDTGGEFLFSVLEVGEEEQEPEFTLREPVPSLGELMSRDPLFLRLVDQGLADLAARRYRPVDEIE